MEISLPELGTTPQTVLINGATYVRSDVDLDAWEMLSRLCKEFGVDNHRAYEARRMGCLDARMPKGLTRGMRVKRSEFIRWMREGNVGGDRCE